MEETNVSNGSAGRFLRIEEKLDTLIERSNEFQVNVVERLTRLEERAIEARARLEEAVTRAKDEIAQSAVEARAKVSTDAGVARNVVTDEASDRSYFWLRIGIIASIVLSIAGLIFRAIWG